MLWQIVNVYKSSTLNSYKQVLKLILSKIITSRGSKCVQLSVFSAFKTFLNKGKFSQNFSKGTYAGLLKLKL